MDTDDIIRVLCITIGVLLVLFIIAVAVAEQEHEAVDARCRAAEGRR